jgi:disulfide bond formation protein DsbB
LAWLVSIVATGGSLYFSEVMGFIPCALCWYQRIFMYPLVIILGIASFRSDRRITGYVLPLSVIGLSIAFYHYFLVEQKLLGELESPLCQVGVPCDTKYIEWLGFITIPFLSLVAFTLITAFMIYVRRASPAAPETQPGPAADVDAATDVGEGVFKSSIKLPVLALLLAGAGTLTLGLDLSRKYPGESPATWSIEQLTEAPGALQIDGMIQPGEYQNRLNSSRIKMDLYWSVHEDRVSFGLKAPTQGWVALGLNAEIPLMRGADIVIGYVKDDQLYLEDSYANSRIGHQTDIQLGGRDDVLDRAGTQDEGGTIIEFSRRLDTGDGFDTPIRPAEKMMILLAYGQRDDLISYHDRMRALMANIELVPVGR